jgi:hypothetical protein
MFEASRWRLIIPRLQLRRLDWQRGELISRYSQDGVLTPATRGELIEQQYDQMVK